jgi:hypothetical protein
MKTQCVTFISIKEFMLHKTRSVILAFAALSTVCAFAQTTNSSTSKATDNAKDVACLIEGAFAIAGFSGNVKDCIENKGAMTQSEFKSACESLAKTSAMLGGQPGKVTYIGSCPRMPIAVCDGSGWSTYYYIANPNRGSSELKEGCDALGGKAR